MDNRTIDVWIEAYSEEIGPKRGAHIVAKAWSDPDDKARLMADAPFAIKELGYLGEATGHLKVVENSDGVHNLVVCTLCSCYPFSILGVAPNWYKMAAYRSRAVRDPRGVLAESGVEIDDDTEIRVWDSTAELRYLVLPQRPDGTDDLAEAELAALVTRNSMIGTDRGSGSRRGCVMDGPHDLGGKEGFGPIQVDEPDAAFHKEWEGRMWGPKVLTLEDTLAIDAKSGTSYQCDIEEAPKFTSGEAVRTQPFTRQHHTRLPAYTPGQTRHYPRPSRRARLP